MSGRVIAWVLGPFAGFIAAALLPEDLFPGVRLLAFAGLSAGFGLLGEAIAWISQRQKRQTETYRPRDTRPADGRVDRAAVTGVRNEPNPHAPRFARFVAIEGERSLGERSPDSRSRGRSSSPLLGRVVVFSVFVGRDERAWTDEEVARSHTAIVRAGEWLEREARRWAAAVNLEVADTYFVTQDDVMDEIAIGIVEQQEAVGLGEVGSPTKALLGATRAAGSLGFRDAEHLFRSIDARVEADATVWLIHPRRAGQSIAVPREDSELPGVSLALCYAYEAEFPAPLIGPARTDPVTVVHELLHLFGASDKYGRSLDGYDPHAVTEREVMRLSETRLSRLRVDTQTAREVGWAAGSKPWPERTTTASSRSG